LHGGDCDRAVEFPERGNWGYFNAIRGTIVGRKGHHATRRGLQKGRSVLEKAEGIDRDRECVGSRPRDDMKGKAQGNPKAAQWANGHLKWPAWKEGLTRDLSEGVRTLKKVYKASLRKRP